MNAASTVPEPMEELTLESIERARALLLRMPLDGRAAQLLVFLEDRAVNEGGLFYVGRLRPDEHSTLERLIKGEHIRVETLTAYPDRQRGDPTHVVTLLSTWAWEQAHAARKLKAQGRWSVVVTAARLQSEAEEAEHDHSQHATEVEESEEQESDQ